MPSVFGTLKIDTIGPIEYRILENCMQRPLGLPKTLDLNMLNKNSNRKLLKDVMCKYMNR